MIESDRLNGFDFIRHNEEVEEAWESYRSGRPTRTPIFIGLNTRYFMLNPEANSKGAEFHTYAENPDLMYDTLLSFQRWSRFNVLQDAELGLPEQWQIQVDFQNYYEAAWFGCPLVCYGDQVPDTRPAFSDCPERIMEDGLPDSFGGIMGRGLEYHEYFQERAAREDFLGRPVSILPPWLGIGSDGPMTVACNLFGPEFVCITMATDESRFHVLMDFITSATIHRMMAWRRLTGVPIPQDDFIISDDSIALISAKMYREYILPYHKRIYARFGTANGRGIHLCGDATRHFPTLRDALAMEMFDTGFPVDFERLRGEVGMNVRIQGGPHVELLLSRSPSGVYEETRRIMQSRIVDGGLFVLREGNNLAPGTPLENTEAMYRAGREFGKFRRNSWAD